MSSINIKSKITIEDRVLYTQILPRDSKLKFMEGDSVQANEDLLNNPADSQQIKVKFEGRIMVVNGQKVKKGDVIAEKKKLFRKFKQVFEKSGIVDDIGDGELTLKVDNTAFGQKAIKVVSPFDARIEKVLTNRVILSFSGIQLNLFQAKGDTAVGKLAYLPSSNFRDKEYMAKKGRDIKDSILVTDHMTSELYPLFSALGVKGIIANSIDYNLYNDIIILAVPIGIISGFGSTLPEDKTLVKWFKSIEGSDVWFDGTYKRVICPNVNSKPPAWVANYSFSIDIK